MEVDYNQIRIRVRQAFQQAGPQPWLVGYDATAIQDFITQRGRPISMAGASKTIKDFDVHHLNAHALLFAGGGRGIGLARSQQEAISLCNTFIDDYRQRTCGEVLAATCVRFDPKKERESLLWFRQTLEVAKDAAHPPQGHLPLDKEFECQDCRRYHVRQNEQVCLRCDTMTNMGRRSTDQLSKSLVDLSEDGRIVAVSADGNNLGALFDSIDRLEELAAVSEAVSAIFNAAHTKALDTVKSNKLPLVTGGDDLRAFLPPSALYGYINTLVQQIEQRTARTVSAIKKLLSHKADQALGNLGISIGVVMASDHYPAWRLMDYAHELEQHAKKACHSKTYRSAFDLAVITSEHALTHDIESLRNKHDRRPFSMDPERWGKTIKLARALSKLNPSQLAILAQAHTMPIEEFSNLFRYQVARSHAWQTWYDDCGFDWKDPVAVIKHRPDQALLDLSSFIPKEPS